MDKFNLGDVCRYYMPHSPELHGKLCRILAVSGDGNDYSTTCMDTLKKHFVEKGDLEIAELYNNTSTNYIKVGDIGTYNNGSSTYNHGICTVEAIHNNGFHLTLKCSNGGHITAKTLNFTKLSQQHIMTTTAKVIQERIVKKYLTNKKLDELTSMIEEIRLIVDNKKGAMKLLQDDLKTLEEIDIEINLAIDNLDIDYIKTLEEKYKEYFNCN